MSSMVPFWASTDSGFFCPQSGARVQSHAVRRRLFIVQMTAAHISPNVFSLRDFLSNIHVLFFIIHSSSFILIIHHIQASNYILLLHDKFALSFLQLFKAGRLPSVSCVRYITVHILNLSCFINSFLSPKLFLEPKSRPELLTFSCVLKTAFCLIHFFSLDVHFFLYPLMCL